MWKLTQDKLSRQTRKPISRISEATRRKGKKYNRHECSKIKEKGFIIKFYYLRARITTSRPPKWPFDIFLQQGVLLLNTIPVFSLQVKSDVENDIQNDFNKY